MGMLRRAENVTLIHRPGFWTGKGPAILTIGKHTFLLAKMSRADFEDRWNHQQQYPSATGRHFGRRYWHFQNEFYWENEGLDADQVRALIVTQKQRRSQQIDRAQSTFAMGSTPRRANARKAIPDDVKQYVWTRDGGQCRNCGSTVELQFDHIIPIARGGGNQDDNLQILCGPCNRSKSAGLTTRR